jgi:nucleoside-diphosphate-sugar epimerase
MNNKFLITGGAGIVGSNFVLNWLSVHTRALTTARTSSNNASPGTDATLSILWPLEATLVKISIMDKQGRPLL